ncbi:MAG: Por secretion system protein [Prevotella sp.]|nr:Por secretion system protein [Prevotella sp.]
MKRILTIWSLLMVMITPLAAIGQWKAYMAYHHITDIEPAGKLVYVLSTNDLFSYNVNDNSVTIYNKVNSLSDSYIDFIAWNNTVKKLIIVYNNQNIDLLDMDDQVENICDYHNKTLLTSKTVYNITINRNDAYLSTASGILKINMKNAEISDTYYFGEAVNDVTLQNNTIYALTVNGTVYQGNRNNNLTDPASWTTTTDHPTFTDDNDITISNNNGYQEYIAYDRFNKCYWSNQSDGKLQQYTLSDEGIKTVLASNINPEGPKYNLFSYMKIYNGKLYTCGSDNNSQAGIQVLNDNQWTIYEDEGISEKTGVSNVGAYCLDIDPKNEAHIFAGARNGLYEYLDGKFINYYDSDNSPIESYNLKNKEYQLVTGVKYDQSGTLWILNSQAPNTSMIQLKDGHFTKYNKEELMKLNDGGFNNKSNGELSKMMIDSQGLMWFVNNNWVTPALYQYDITNDQIKAYETIINQDGTTINGMYHVYFAEEDLNHNLWIGTDVGPFMLERSEINNGGSTFTQVKVPRNDGTNLADYLLANVDIYAMAIDGGGRKWFGTNGNGVYLISADNNEQIYHFTAENSPLLSDVIHSIVINNTTGEVFFGTDKGLCSYQSDAVTANEEMTKDNVWAYPNPVRPDYTGLITIVGLSFDSDVKILTANGTVVNEGRSNGGSYTWDGCDKNGKRVASGVYMVATATSDGKKGTVCKIAIVN